MTRNEKTDELLRTLRDLEKQIVELLGYDLPKGEGGMRIETEEVETERKKPQFAPEDLELMAVNYLHELGCPAHIKGYRYSREAILMCIQDMSYIEAITKRLYREIAQKFATTPSRVERAIRHAIEVSWSRGNMEVIEDIFGYTFCHGKGKPTNSEFIALIADRIRLDTHR